jgi:tetratricopeptide (TPR) repeat protein
MTDLCYEADAEERCEEAVSAAVAIAPNNAEVLSTLASLRISQSRPEEAAAALTAAVAAWADAPDAESVETRLGVAKMLVEVGKASDAVGVTEEVLESVDTIAEVHYVQGVALVELGEREEALTVLARCQEVAQQEGDQEMYDAAAQLLEGAQELFKDTQS